ncbi:hypothetical protein D3C81_1395690 [compost metagenome]
MRRFVEVVRGLHRQAAALAQLADQARIQRRVVRHPLQRGIGQDQVLLFGGGPLGNIGNGAAHAGHAQPLALAGFFDHVRVAVQRYYLGIGVTLQQHLGRVARAATQVDSMAYRVWRHGGQQIADGAGALVFEQGILGGGPGHVRLLWAGNALSISHVLPVRGSSQAGTDCLCLKSVLTCACL